VHYNKSRIYNRQGNYEEAILELKKMLKTDPYFRPALTDLAQLYFEKKQMYSEAAECLKTGIKAYPEDASLYNNLGNIYFMTKSPEKAVLAFKKAVDLKPDKDYYYNLGCVYYTMEDMANADFYLKKAMEMAPDEVKIAVMLARVKKFVKLKNGK
jgi:tetratricopeptide (TPR) repeat protein